MMILMIMMILTVRIKHGIIIMMKIRKVMMMMMRIMVLMTNEELSVGMVVTIR